MKLFCMMSVLGLTIYSYSMDSHYVSAKGISSAAYKKAVGYEPDKKCPWSKLFHALSAAVEHNLQNAPSYSDSSQELMALIKKYEKEKKYIVPLKGTRDPIVSRVRYLLKKGADPAMHDEYGDTPLHKVVDMADDRSYQVVRVLIDYGAPVESKDITGSTPFDIALSQCSYNSAMFKLLLAHASEQRVQEVLQAIRTTTKRKGQKIQQLESLLSNRLSLGQPVRSKIIKEKIIYVHSLKVEK